MASSLLSNLLALSLSTDSCCLIQALYPLCFGGNVIHPQPSIVFNFSMDTLYFDADIGPHVGPFLFSLEEKEADNIQCIAIDRYLDDNMDKWSYSGVSSMETLQKASRSMQALKEVLAVVKLDEYWHVRDIPERSGPIELFETQPTEVQLFVSHELIHLDDEDAASECEDMPDMENLLEDFQAPTKSIICRWRRTALPLAPYPWDEEFERRREGNPR